MDTDSIFSKYFSEKPLSVSEGALCEILKDGSLRRILNAPRVVIEDMISEEPKGTSSNIVVYRFTLSAIEDPFWLSLFSFFQQSGFSVHIDENHVLQITTFGGLFGTTMSIARNCVSLANSTYSHYRNVAMNLAKKQDGERLRAIRRDTMSESETDDCWGEAG